MEPESVETTMYYGEKLNSISHLIGAALALIGLGALLAVSYLRNLLSGLLNFFDKGSNIIFIIEVDDRNTNATVSAATNNICISYSLQAVFDFGCGVPKSNNVGRSGSVFD